MTGKLYEYIKRRGFLDTIIILGQNGRMNQKVFFNYLKNSDGYYNSYLRSKQHLIDGNVIQFSLDKDKKMISLTDKGMEIFKKIKELEELLD